MDVILELIDDTTGEVFAESEVALDSLPQYFSRMDTRLTLGDSEYEVTHAEPANRDDIGLAGRVRLRLRKVAFAVDAKKTRYTHPSIEDLLPPRDRAAEGAESPLDVAPDDFRQIELVRASLEADVDAELDAIRVLTVVHRREGGFDAVHVRKRVGDPLGDAGVTRAEVEAALGAKGRPLALRGQSGVVRGGFAIPQAESMVYGIEHEGTLVVLCVQGDYREVAGALHPIARKHALLLVDWCGTRCLRAHEDGFVA